MQGDGRRIASRRPSAFLELRQWHDSGVTNSTRHLREQEILDAALDELRHSDPQEVSMTVLARRTGLSRAAIYQYFSSVSDVFAELVINDMADLVNTIEERVAGIQEPHRQVRCWVESSLGHLASGDHAVVRRLSELGLPAEKRGIIQALHGQFMMALLAPIGTMGVQDVEATASFVASTVNAAANRVDRGSSVARETELATTYVMAALRGMVEASQARDAKRGRACWPDPASHTRFRPAGTWSS